MNGSNSVRGKIRNRRIAGIGILLAALCASMFGQSTARGKSAGHGKLEARLEQLDRSIVPWGKTIGVIMQFEEDRLEGDTAQANNQKRVARRKAIAAACGVVGKEFDGFPMHSADVTFDALKRLENNPLVKRISLDHPVHGDLSATAKAIGADQVWAGRYPRMGGTGKGITVAVIDSGVGDNGYSAWDLWKQVRVSYNFVPGTTSV